MPQFISKKLKNVVPEKKKRSLCVPMGRALYGSNDHAMALDYFTRALKMSKGSKKKQDTQVWMARCLYKGI
eukprot:TRINITY_DN6797_c0_g1_i1.p4 TRINITY_DN6797_c0_g1~~TRINITY_DN6797_c0_g1_i1.p4  ORF type:complete len:71 (-),score=16.40 TRINITY_DN6797_c0_g1_i1:199-411(-)